MTIIEQINSMPNADERMEFIKAHYDRHEEGSYHKQYSDEELAEKRSDFTAESITLADMEAEFKEIADQWKTKIKNQKAMRDKLMDAIRFKGEWLNGITYLLADHDKGIMVTYDGDGNFISSRRMKPEERQHKIPMQKVS